MSWCSKMISPLRVLINDLDPANETYSDETLQRLLLTAADIVQQEVKITTTYTTNYDVLGISPDPSSDAVFINFVVMKAACLTNQWSFKEKAITAGITARCGPVSMQSSGAGSTILMALLDGGFCQAYAEMKRQHNFGNTGNIKAVLSPFSHDEYKHSYGSKKAR